MRKSIYPWSGLIRTWVVRLTRHRMRKGWVWAYWVNVPLEIVRDYHLEFGDYLLITLNIFATRKDLFKYIKKSKQPKACRVKTLDELGLGLKG